ncbi:hypothetical protein [Desertihabitans aurantiacus]|uniref:hypothetical protein n=1 Tax=Desertihabitans aurantiacus TaxID=2282477 RepID=UPI000DF7F760|nr:hypothetical protein [Desertihabitans aurantiacus]
MRARPVDPRDQTSEVAAPRYRVVFWTSSSSSEEWQLSEADLDEVLSWVAAHGDGRRHSLWVELPDAGGGVQVVRLRGIDPPASPGTWPSWAREVG